MSDEASEKLRKANEAIVRNDPGAAFQIWHELAMEGNAQAEHATGWCYEQGVGCEIDYAKCVRWWALAASKGIPESMYGLAFSYEKGRGIERNVTVAYCWYALAMRKGYEKAKGDAERLRFLLKPSELREARSVIQKVCGR